MYWELACHLAGQSHACRWQVRLGHRWASIWCRPSAPACGSNSSRAILIVRSGWAVAGARSPIFLTLARAGNPADPNIVIQSLLQHMIMISDMPPTPATGGIMLKSTAGAMIVVNDSGIYLSNGQGASITLIGPTVTINMGALVVM